MDAPQLQSSEELSKIKSGLEGWFAELKATCDNVIVLALTTLQNTFSLPDLAWSSVHSAASGKKTQVGMFKALKSRH